MDGPIEVFESGIRTFLFQTINRSICYKYTVQQICSIKGRSRGNVYRSIQYRLVVPRIMPKEKQDWSTQVWYSAMLKMLVLTPFLLSSRKSMLVLSQTPNRVHQMQKKVSMLVIHLKGSLQKGNNCQEMLLKSYQLCRE